ncbi:glycosyltransferase [Arenibacter sp. BSSL-BM3]|uniref:Glycosyltransferase n=1 Tax=Arenibacter arenosicollis TaxID=2762274 RepID=A0ABR7QTQ2_9FLAO|nr:glycosyltransferase [Arenibacter arenosicollis]MBC8770464.1 glycosyltransferase [Arenibacter arenosicollis]
MSNIFIHYVNWPNTKDNHAGMGYISKYLNSNDQSVILKEFRLFSFRGGRYLNLLKSLLYTIYFILRIKKGDSLFFTEYMTPGSAHQEIIAAILSKIRPDINLIGLVHLTGNGLIKSYTDRKILKNYLTKLDKIWVLGSSLKDFMIGLGIDDNKIFKTFYYVDTEYYKPSNLKTTDSFNVLVQGNQLRDYTLLKQIIAQCPNINFIIMQGIQDLSHLFSDIENVKLKGFVTENELLVIMQNSDASLSVMKDTIGSNVITTSMACGLAMIVSDIGSIRDYCDNENAIFCLKTEDYVNALNYLRVQRDIRAKMKQKSRDKALNFSKEKFLMVFLEEMDYNNTQLFKNK